MRELAIALEKFNRKERNLLVRAVLGHQEKKLLLCEPFCQELACALKLPDMSILPKTAWWATDYHLDWIAGALAVYLGDEDAIDTVRYNPHCHGTRLVTGTQEDIDLLIAVGQNLIMIEAKAHGSWGNKQFKSKLERLKLLLSYYDGIPRSDRLVDFHLILMSPRQPQRLRRHRRAGSTNFCLRGSFHGSSLKLRNLLVRSPVANKTAQHRLPEIIGAWRP